VISTQLVTRALAAFALCATAIPATAQILRAPKPTAAECQRYAAAWRADARTFGASAEGSLISNCGALGDSAIARAIRLSGGESDTAYLWNLHSLAIQHRSPILLAAAQAVAIDHGATLPARIFALLTLLGQYQPAVGFIPSIPYQSLLAPPWPGCRLSVFTDTSDPGPPQSEGSIRSLIASLNSLAASPAEAPQVRSLAKCVAQQLSANPN
jgi:hypothetical protein